MLHNCGFTLCASILLMLDHPIYLTFKCAVSENRHDANFCTSMIEVGI